MKKQGIVSQKGVLRIHQKRIVGVVNAPDLANIPETYVLVVISHFEQERAFLSQGKSCNFLV